jgi:uncharacterized protein YndB with AHSA1/START domain
MNKKQFAYETYIKASREKVWQALTTAEFTAQYFHGTHVESSWVQGTPVKFLYAPGGEVAVEGLVLESNPPVKLSISWHVLYDEAASAEEPSRVTFTLEDVNGQTRLRIVHDAFPDNSVLFEGISHGWPWIISGLKSLLETGEPLPPLANESAGGEQ